MKIEIVSKNFEKNQVEELRQKAAWRLVRSAADRFGDNNGEKKRNWCIANMDREFIGAEHLEEYVRAAYIQYKTERG